MTLDELCALMYAHGCVAAYNMDGGGSSTLLIREGNELKVMTKDMQIQLKLPLKRQVQLMILYCSRSLIIF